MRLYSKHTTWGNCAFWIRVTRWMGLWVLVIALSGFPALSAKAETVTDENVASKIEEANTAADHQALETYFNSKTAEAAKKVRLHEDMLKSYKRRGKVAGPATWMRSHCLSLLREYRQMQEDYESIGELHGWMVKELSKK